MQLEHLKLKLVRKVIQCNDELMLKKILDEFDAVAKVSEEQANYGVGEKELGLRMEDLSPELQESIRQGLTEADHGEVHSQKEEEKYWNKWFRKSKLDYPGPH